MPIENLTGEEGSLPLVPSQLHRNENGMQSTMISSGLMKLATVAAGRS